MCKKEIPKTKNVSWNFYLTRKFCGLKCQHKILRRQLSGRSITPEWRNKISLSRSPYVGSKHPSWKGGRRIRRGYVYIWVKEHPNKTTDGVMAEHRLVMEKSLGRYLTKEERVHHLNGNKSDNKLENLILFPNENEHERWHYKNDKKQRLKNNPNLKLSGVRNKNV